jgi:hypothetical protein
MAMEKRKGGSIVKNQNMYVKENTQRPKNYKRSKKE